MALTISGFNITGNLTAVHIIPPPPPSYYLWSWGSGGYGKLGLGNTTSYSSPKQVGAPTNWLNVAAGQGISMSTKTDGTMWCWGRNVFGNLGLGNTTFYSSPKQIGSLTTWSKIACGRWYTMAIKTNGTLWSFGQNNQGQFHSR